MSSIYQCVSCQEGSLREEATSYLCCACGYRYPIRFGVPLLMKEVSWQRSDFTLSESLARRICEVAGIRGTEEEIQTLREALSHDYTLPQTELSAENNYYFHRVAAALAVHGQEDPELTRLIGGAPRIDENHSHAVNKDVRYRIEHHYLDKQVIPGASFSRNVRITNIGSSTISSRGAKPVHLSYHWRDAEGNILVWEGQRTSLLIDLPPGRSLTMPMKFRAPRHQGPAVLELTLVQKNGLWMDDQSALLDMEISGSPITADLSWVTRSSQRLDYSEDHLAGREMILERIAAHPADRPRILELGGCCHPQMERAEGEVYNVDIDIQTLQVGALRAPWVEGRLRYLAADANELPFMGECFDFIVMFSTLHHFPDPAGLLARAKKHLRPGGLLAVLCEPVGNLSADRMVPDVLRELLQGINEQCFSLEEYRHIFELAGLESVEAITHDNSLKALLRPKTEPSTLQVPRLRPSGHVASPCHGPLSKLWSWLRKSA